jgi:hypothetical protein
MTAPCLPGSAVSPTVSPLHRLRPRAESRPPETQGARMMTFAEASWRSAAAAEWRARIFDMGSLIRRPSRLTTTSFDLVFRTSAFLERHSQRSVRTIRCASPASTLSSRRQPFTSTTSHVARGEPRRPGTQRRSREALQAQKARRVNSPSETSRVRTGSFNAKPFVA